MNSLVCSGAFKLYDVDNDGYITREEMYNIVGAIYEMVVCNAWAALPDCGRWMIKYDSSADVEQR